MSAQHIMALTGNVPSIRIIPRMESKFAPMDWVLLNYGTDIPPLNVNWTLPLLRNRSQIGKIIGWQVGFDVNTSELVTWHGCVDGKIQEDRLEVHTNQSGRNLLEQAWLQAKKKYLDKTRTGYRLPEDNSPIELPVQLANEYIKKDTGRRVTLHFPVTVQPKLDGMRGIIRRRGGEIEVASRNGLLYSWLDHIRKEADILLMYLPPGVALDGEIYSFDFTFNQLSSIVKTVKHCHTDNDKVKYYFFDILIPEKTLEERIDIMERAWKKAHEDGHPLENIIKVQSYLANSDEEIERSHNLFVSMGYEGVMIRKLSQSNPTEKGRTESYYKGKRNNNLLKYKHFTDEEGIVIDILDGEGREKGLAILKVRDPCGNEFAVRPRADFETRKEWFENKAHFIGKQYTYRFQELSEYGVPRFPVGIAFRDYE